MNHDIHKLRDFLKSIQPGPVPEDLKSELVTLVASCWENFDGSNDCGMATYKIERLEDPKWDPPILTFTIERHGAIMMGSTRAELQEWVLDLDEGTASCDSGGYRQLHPRAAAWKAEPVGEELARIIMAGEEDPRLKWLSEGKDRVKVLTPSIIPDYHGPKETTNTRRRKFFKSMEKHLSPAGWQRAGNIWKKDT